MGILEPIPMTLLILVYLRNDSFTLPQPLFQPKPVCKNGMVELLTDS